MTQNMGNKMKIKNIIKEALAEKGYFVEINWIEYSSYIGFNVDMTICTIEEAKAEGLNKNE